MPKGFPKDLLQIKIKKPNKSPKTLPKISKETD